MYRKVREYIKTWQMLGEKDKVIVGVSGGADSICLLFMLLELRKELHFEITAVHVNHQLRGEGAQEDELYVRNVCRAEKVELIVFSENVKEYAKQKGLSSEEAGREVRRARFLQVMEEYGGTCIALAHHQNDNAETILWNLCRGTGLKGIGGISPKKGVWIRPLLCLNRMEIESYLEKKGISYCTDETNLEDDYTRNKIRNRVIPYLEQNINAQTVAHITECSEQLRAIGEYVAQETAKYAKSCTQKTAGGELLLKKDAFENVPDALKSSVVHEIICTVAGKSKDISSVHVKALQELLENQVGRKIALPYEIEVLRSYEGLKLYKTENQCRNKEAKYKEQDKKEPENLFELRVFGKCAEKCAEKCTERCAKPITFPENTYTKWFDYDIIKNAVKIRHREPGDYIVIDKSGKTQKLKQYFINEKIPQEKRKDIWLVADGKEIIWIVGYRQSQAYQIKDTTKRILEIRFYGGEKDGGDGKGKNSRGRSCKENRSDGKTD